MSSASVPMSQGPLTPYPSAALAGGIDAVFRARVKEFGASPAVTVGAHAITYAALDGRVEAWASLLVTTHRVTLEEPIALLLEPGIDQIAAQLGVLRAGGSCVPLDPAQPDARLQDMVGNLGVRLVITLGKWEERLLRNTVAAAPSPSAVAGPLTRTVLLVENLTALGAPTRTSSASSPDHIYTADAPPSPPAPQDRPLLYKSLGMDHRTHLLHTSGTTGRPKAVEVVAKSILRLVFNQSFSPIGPGDVWAHVSNPTFDASLYEVYGALLHGASIVIIPRQTLIDPFALRDTIRATGITAMCITTALFNLTALALPDAFTGVRHVLVGGEAANAHALREVLLHSKVANLRNAYGPTECVVYATTLHITPEEVASRNGAAAPAAASTVSIGRAIDNTVVFILDERQRPITVGGDAAPVGEVYIGGDGLARGYAGQPDLTADRFVTLSLPYHSFPLVNGTAGYGNVNGGGGVNTPSAAGVIAQNKPSAEDRPIRLYRTGDLARWRHDGTIDYLGRADHQIKLRGHRIELQEIESCILDAPCCCCCRDGDEDSAVSDKGAPLLPLEGVVVDYIKPLGNDGDAAAPVSEGYLLAYIVVAATAADGATANATVSSDSPAVDALRAHLKSRLPAYMVPRVMVVPYIPLNPNGKADRRVLRSTYVDAALAAPAAAATCTAAANESSNKAAAAAGDDDASAPIDVKVRRIWADILGVPAASLGPSSNFFEVGGSSLQAASLMLSLRRRLSAELPISALYEHPVLEGFCAAVAHWLSNRAGLRVHDTIVALRNDAKLAAAIPLPAAAGEAMKALPIVDWTAPSEGRVFVTGVTGFVGAFFLFDMLTAEDRCVKAVACLVRASTAAEGLDRIRQNMAGYGLWRDDFANRIIIQCGSLGSDEYLGLGAASYRSLARWVSVIFHLGAFVSYTQPYGHHREANVMGTLNILKLSNAASVARMEQAAAAASAVPVAAEPPSSSFLSSLFCGGSAAAAAVATPAPSPAAPISAARIGVHYVSSIAAYGPTGFFTGVKEVFEDDRLDTFLPALKYDTGYSQSQWVAERLVWAAEQRGMAVAIYRPGFVMGDSHKGIGNSKDFVARLIKGCVLLGSFPRLENQSKEFIAVDYIADRLFGLAKRLASYGHAFNLVPTGPSTATSLIDLHGMLVKGGYPRLALVPYSQWVQSLAASDGLAANPLLPLLPMLQEPVYGTLTRWEVYEHMPHYRTDNVQAVYGADAPCPTLTQAMVNKYLASWRASGFLPARIA